MKKIPLLLLLLCASFSISTAQVKRAAHWYFGYRAGLNFSSGVAAADTTGQLISIEGCSAISDTLGNLLFYSNGEKIWNRNGALMPNGAQIIGDESSAQSSIILPKPGNLLHYYLFTSSSSGPTFSGLYYNEVDMSLAGSFGDVIPAFKDVFLHSFFTEELAATKHCNTLDYWVVGREALQDTLKLYAYPVSSSGVGPPVVSKIPCGIMSEDYVGGLTFSVDGSLLIHTSFTSANISVMNFNTQTGQITLQTNIPTLATEMVYSNALSHDATRLYTVSWRNLQDNFISQFDLSAANVAASRKKLDSLDFSNGSPNGYGFIGQMRLGPDQKIYVSRWHQRYPYQIDPSTFYSLDSLGVINAPNNTALTCNYQRNGFYLKGKPTQIGLPNFVSNFLTAENKVSSCAVVTALHPYAPELAMGVYPNPFADKTTVHLYQRSEGSVQLKLTDAFGKSYEPAVTEIPGGFELRRGNLSPGLYFLSVWQQNQLLGEQKIMVQ